MRNTSSFSERTKLAPGPRGFDLLKRLLRLRNEPFQELIQFREDFGDIIRVRMPHVAHLISHPDYLKHVYKDNAKNYTVRGKEFYEVEPLLGRGVLLSNGPLWTKQRRTVAGEFHSETVKTFAEPIVALTQKMLDTWERELSSRPAREMTEAMSALTLEIAADVFFGTHVENGKVIAEAVNRTADLANRRIRAFVKFPRWFPLPQHLLADRAIRRVDRIVYELIAGYAVNRPARTNVLTRLMDAREKDGVDRMTDKLLRDEIVTLLISGHETTSSTLFWTLYCLARNPDVEERLAAEVREVLGDRPPTAGDLEKLPYSRWVLQETLRLFPAFANLSKEVAEDDEIGGCFIPGGSLMNVCVYLAHRHPEFWENPELYIPDRFAPAAVAARHPYAHVPFGKGPRACIGEHFAMLEGQLILCLLIQRFRFQLVDRQAVKPVARITIFPKSGIRMVLERRR